MLKSQQKGQDHTYNFSQKTLVVYRRLVDESTQHPELPSSNKFTSKLDKEEETAHCSCLISFLWTIIVPPPQTDVYRELKWDQPAGKRSIRWLTCTNPSLSNAEKIQATQADLESLRLVGTGTRQELMGSREHRGTMKGFESYWKWMKIVPARLSSSPADRHIFCIARDASAVQAELWLGTGDLGSVSRRGSFLSIMLECT